MYCRCLSFAEEEVSVARMLFSSHATERQAVGGFSKGCQSDDGGDEDEDKGERHEGDDEVAGERPQ